jgi:D-serine deaminase-like pyridoxal phosphate-dependent protein
MGTPPVSLDGLETPALLLDLDIMEANLAAMAARLRDRGITLRPHAKTHKSAHVARRQLDHGAAGLTVATIAEAEAFARHGFTDLFIAYPVVARGIKADRLAGLARRVKLRVGVDSVAGAQALAGALTRADAPAPAEVLIEIDSGHHRTGVPPTAAGELAAACRSLGLDVAGVFTHGGHSYAHPGGGAEAAKDEDAALSEAARQLTGAGFDVREVSAGSTPTVPFAGRHVTEERPGTYAFYDRQQLMLGSCDAGQIAVTIAATVVSTAVSGQAVIDAGSKALASDRPGWLTGHGSVPGLGDAVVASLSENHGMVDLGGWPAPPVGTVVTVVPNHVCTAVNLFDSYTLLRSGHLAGSWPVDARGHLT